MPDAALPVAANLVGGLTSGTFAFKLDASDISQGAILSAQSDGINGTMLSIGASLDNNGWGPGLSKYTGDVDAGHLYFPPRNYGGPLLKSAATLQAGRDYSIVLTFSETSASLYIDGKLDVTVAGNVSTPIFGNTVAAIGTWISPEGHFMMRDFGGTIGQAMLFDHALTRAEALALSKSGTTDVATSGAETSDALGNHHITGSVKDDSLAGGALNDLIQGGGGRDTLNGGEGADTLAGGRGTDVLTGGLGADVFLFASLAETGTAARADHITDFLHGTDKIDLAGAGALSFIGKGNFTQHGGEVRFSLSQGALQIDLDADGKADAAIFLDGVTTFNAGDLIL